jgi:trk system potassium uptake protein TrkH
MFDKPIKGYENDQFFYSILATFGCAGTGGFGFIPNSIELFNPFSQYVMSIFLILFGCNFSLYYLILIGKAKSVFKSEEFKTYFIIVGLAVAIIFISLINRFQNFPQQYTIEEAFRHSLFQVASILTTTGFTTTDFQVWPVVATTVLTLLMFFGAMAGSTAGGIKVSRIIIAIKGAYIKIRKLINPHYVPKARFEGKILEQNTINDVFSFLTLYFFILLAVLLVLSFDPINGELITITSNAGTYEVKHGFYTNFSATLACLSNIGPGFDAVGPYASYAEYSYFSKIILTFTMLLGRLEILPVLILFNKKTESFRDIPL